MLYGNIQIVVRSGCFFKKNTAGRRAGAWHGQVPAAQLYAAYAGGVFVVAGGEYHPPERPKWAPRKVQASRNRERRHGPNVGLRCFRGAERHPYEGDPDDAVRRRRFYDVRDRAAALAGRWGDRTALLPGTHGGAYRGVRARAFQ